MSGEVAKISKPDMRGLLNKQIGKNLGVTFALVFIAGIAFKIGVMDSRKNKYAEYYKTFNADALFKEMKAAGVFNSVPK